MYNLSQFKHLKGYPVDVDDWVSGAPKTRLVRLVSVSVSKHRFANIGLLKLLLLVYGTME